MKKTISYFLTFVLLISVLFNNTAKADTVETKRAGKITVSFGSLNIRKEPNTNSDILYSIPKDKNITLISLEDDWWKVEYSKDKFGYSHKDYITVINSVSKIVNTKNGALNVRKGRGTDYEILNSLKKGHPVLVLSTKDGWSRILYNGKRTGYVSSNYLIDASNEEYKEIILSIPSYKQTDKRWANVKIGNSGKTIAQIGCVTTGIAMIESYRNNKVIYPDAMSKKLKYTSSGNVYWPSDYKSNTTKTGYLDKIYKELENNKAVLFGGKTSGGSQHWVVITGYKGGDNLSSTNFTINDPGSNTRKTLKSFLNAYPTFYKYFTY